MSIHSPAMRTVITLFTTATTLAFTLATAHGSASPCDATQQIRLSFGDRQIDQWSGTTDNIRHLVLPNGFKLGVKIEQASREKYEDFLKRMRKSSVPELVRISLYDETEATPRLMTYTFGGANSLQGYGPRGGADRVDEVGSPGIEFRLSKANCANQADSGLGVAAISLGAAAISLSAADIAALPTAAMLKQTNEKSQPSAENKRGMDAAIADARAGKYIINYPSRTLSPPEMEVLKREFENAGLQFGTPDEANSGGYNKGYTRAMIDAIKEKFGATKMREIEANIKVSMAALVPASAAK